MEQKEIHDMLAGVTDADDTKQVTKAMLEYPISSLTCPSRRAAKLLPVGTKSSQQSTPYVAIGLDTVLAAKLDKVARSCYAGNGGSIFSTFDAVSVTEVSSKKSQDKLSDIADLSNGIFFACSTIAIRDIADGTSSTFLVGEKNIRTDYYETAQDFGDNENILVGDDRDNVRWTGPDYPPMQDTPGVSCYYSFGSAHPGAFNMANCDGSVRSLNYDIDPRTYENLGNRKDGEVISLEQQ